MADKRDGGAPPEFHTALRLVPATAAIIVAEAYDRASFAALLGAAIHPAWHWPDLGDSAGLPTPDALTVAWAREYPERACWLWYIIHAPDNLLIGSIGTANPPTPQPGEDSCQISYQIAPDYRRRGLMTEAARVYVAWAFTHPELSWIYALTEADNIASQRVLAKLGAQRLPPQDAETGWIEWEMRRG